ncbi:MAG: Fimbrillin-like [Bacteroidetes bacterium]|nr:Fimbrillin-like [Bacteroidota bacterium]
MKKIWIFAALAAVMVSCSNEQDPSNQTSAKQVALSLSGSTEAMITTKASTVDLPAATQVGVYALETAPSTITMLTTPFKNVLYSATGASGAFTSTSPIYLLSTKQYSACAYAPQVSTVSDVTAVPFVHGTDVLYAPTKTVTITPGSPAIAAVDLTFSHKMSQIKFSLVAGTGTPDLTGAVLSVTGFNESCTMNITDGSVTPVKGVGASITDIDKATCFVPNSSDMLLDVKVTTTDNRSYTGTISRVFGAGSSYSFTITLNKNDTKLGITGHVIDWVSVNGGNVPVEG